MLNSMVRKSQQAKRIPKKGMLRQKANTFKNTKEVSITLPTNPH